MEKVMVASAYGEMFNADLWEINDCLKYGWSVKSVTMTTSEGRVTAIFVLEKKE